MTLVLVLGGTGFLGRAVVSALQMTGVEAVAAGRHGGPFLGAGPSVDLTTIDARALARLIDDLAPTTVVDCVGRTDGTLTELVAANVSTVARLLEALEIATTRPRLIHAGSAAEYGSGPKGEAVTERMSAHPAGPYGITKLAATELIRNCRDRRGLEATTMRVFNVIGPGMAPNLLAGAMVMKLSQAVRANANEVTTGPLDAVRDFVDVRDVARAIVSASLATEPPPAVVNIGRGVPSSARELVLELARQLGYEGRIVEADPGSPRSGGVDWQVADITLAATALDWVPEHGLEAMCAQLLAGAP